MASSTTVSRAVLEIGTDDQGLRAGIAGDKQEIRAFADQVREWAGQVKGDFKSAGESAKAFGAQFGDVFGDKASRQATQAAQNIAAVGGAVKLTGDEVKQHLAALDTWIAKAQKLGTEVSPSILSAREALVKVNAEADKAPSILERIRSGGVAVGTAIGSFFGGLASNAVQGALSGLVSFGEAAIADAGALVDMSNKTGLSTEFLQRLGYVAKQSGSDVSEMSDAAVKLGTNIAGGKGSVRDAAAALGLQWSTLRAMRPEEQFDTVSAALAAMENPQERNRLALELFGKSFAKIIPSLVDGYQKLKNEANVASDAQVRALDAAGDAWDAFVDRQKKTVTAWLGNMVIARDTVDKLTAEQHAQYLAILKSGGDAQAFLLDMAKKMAAAHDVNLPVETKGGESSSFVADLKAAESAYRGLTAAKKSEIEAAVALNKSNDDIVKSLGIEESVIAVAKKAIEDKKTAETKARQETEQHTKAVAELTDKFSGQAKKVTELTEALAGIGAHGDLKGIADAAGKLSADGATLTPELTQLAIRFGTLGAQAKVGADGIGEVGFKIDVAVPKLSALNEGILEMQGKTKAGAEGLTDLGFKAEDGFGAAVDGAKKAKEKQQEFSKSIQDVSAALADMAQVSGGAFGGVARELGSVVTAFNTVEKSIHAIGEGSATSGLKGVFQMTTGFIGLATAALSVGKAIRDAFFGTAGRDSVKDFASSLGGFDALHTKLLGLGAAGEQLWVKLTQGVGRNNPEQAKQVIDEITKALDNQKQTHEQLLQTQNQQLGDLISQVQGLGAGTLLQPYLDRLTDAKDLTSENLALLKSLASDGTVSFDQMQKAAQALGISTDALGPSFQAAKAQADWQSIIDNMDTLVRGGADLNALLGDEGLQKHIDDLVISSLKFGTEIPANAKPWVEQLAAEGKLLDENGNKITDTSKLKFGGDLVTSMQNLIDKIGLLIDKLSGVPAALDKIPDSKDIDVTFHGRRDGDWPDGTSDVDRSGIDPIPMAGGGAFHVSRPTLFLAGERPGGEDVVFSGIGRQFAGAGTAEQQVVFRWNGRTLLSQVVRGAPGRLVFEGI